MCHIFQIEQITYFLGRVCRNHTAENTFLKSFLFINIIKYERTLSSFFCHLNLSRKIIGSKSGMNGDEIWITWCPPIDFQISSQVINTKVDKNTFQMKSTLSLQEPVSPAHSGCQGRVVQGSPGCHLPGLPSPLLPFFRSWEGGTGTLCYTCPSRLM